MSDIVFSVGNEAFEGCEIKRTPLWNYLTKLSKKVPKIDVMLTVFDGIHLNLCVM